jgi:tetratricopeptide (TPR) repeat protein
MVTEDEVAVLRYIAADLLANAQQEGDVAAADEAIALLRKAASVDCTSRAEAVSELAGALDVRYELTADPALLDQITETDRLAVALTRADDPAVATRLLNLSFGLKRHYERTGDVVTLDQALAALRAAIEAPSPPGQDRAACLFELLVLLRSRFKATRSAADLDGAIEAGRQAVAAASLHDPQLRQYLSGLSGVLFSRYDGTGDLAVLKEAVFLLRAAIDKTPRHDAAWLHRNGMLGLMLRQQYERTGDLQTLDQAISAAQAVVAATAADSPEMTTSLSALSLDLHQRFGRTGDPADFAEALRLVQRVVQLTAPNDPWRANALSNLSVQFHSWFTHSGDVSALDDAVRYGREAIAALGPDAENRTMVLTNQVTVLTARATTGEPTPAVLDEAVEIARLATAEMSPADPAGAAARSNLAFALLLRHESALDPADLAEATAAARQTLTGAFTIRSVSDSIFATGRRVLEAAYDDCGDLALLDEAIEAARAAVAVTPDDHPQYGARLTALGNLLVKKFDHTKALPDLDEAIDLADRATRAPAPDENSRWRRLLILADSLDRRFGHAADLGDLDRAITAATEAVHVLGAASSDEYDAVSMQARLLKERWERVPDATTLSQAIDASRRAVEIARDDDELAAQLGRLSNVLWRRFKLNGDIALLDEAVSISRRVPALVEGPSRASALSNLGTVLGTLYGHVGDLALLDESIAVLRQAVDVAGPLDPDLGRYLVSLANALRRRYDRVRDMTLLRQATVLSRQAVAVTLIGHRDRSGRLANLADRLATESAASGQASKLDESIEIGRQALAEAPQDYPDKHVLYMSLGGPLRQRFRLRQNQADLDEAIDTMRQALQSMPETSTDRTGYLHNLGNGLSERYSLTHDNADISGSIAAFRQAVANVYAAPNERVRAAEAWGLAATAAGRVTEALEGFTRAVELLPSVSPHNLQRPDQEHYLSRYSGLAGLAAASALDAGDPQCAVTLLEQGRGVLLAQALESRSDLSTLREQQPAIAGEFEALRRTLDAAYEQPPNGTDGAVTVEALAAIRRSQAQAWQDLLERIRRTPGFERFLLPPSIPELTAAAHDGPVVLFSVARQRSDAIALTPAGVQAIPLPAFGLDTINEKISTFYSALATIEADTSFKVKFEAETAISDVLGWLWDVAAAPVLDALGYTGQPGPGRPYPRIWWAPTGPASFLPIHAAGYHRSDRTYPMPTVMDRVVSSYTPTIRTLIHLRSRPVSSASASRALLVALGQTPGAADLPDVQREIDGIIRLLPEAFVLEGEEATQAQVLDGLRGASLAHFACHGISMADRPSDSQLLVYDHVRHPLTVLDISRLRLTDPRLAFLSACSTAQPSATLTDEAIHITSAFQLAGYPHVIGTLWTISDVAAATITEAVYEQLATNSGIDISNVAQALHTAVLKTRDDAPMRPSRWAAYVHAGI